MTSHSTQSEPTIIADYIELSIAKHYAGELSRGQLLRALRKNVLNMNQTDYCRLCQIGRNSLNDLELDKGDPKESTLTLAFKPFNLRPGVFKADPDLFEFIRYRQLQRNKKAKT